MHKSLEWGEKGWRFSEWKWTHSIEEEHKIGLMELNPLHLVKKWIHFQVFIWFLSWQTIWKFYHGILFENHYFLKIQNLYIWEELYSQTVQYKWTLQSCVGWVLLRVNHICSLKRLTTPKEELFGLYFLLASATIPMPIFVWLFFFAPSWAFSS